MRVDHVVTHAEYHGFGYGRAVIRHLVNFHAAISSNLLYLYSVSPTATCMYKDAGFVEKQLNLAYWSAWKVNQS